MSMRAISRLALLGLGAALAAAPAGAADPPGGFAPEPQDIRDRIEPQRLVTTKTITFRVPVRLQAIHEDVDRTQVRCKVVNAETGGSSGLPSPLGELRDVFASREQMLNDELPADQIVGEGAATVRLGPGGGYNGTVRVNVRVAAGAEYNAWICHLYLDDVPASSDEVRSRPVVYGHELGTRFVPVASGAF